MAKTAAMDEFTRFYLDQAGGGAGVEEHIGPVYVAGFQRGQRGRGFMDILRGAWSFVSPLFRSGAEAVTKQALSTGANILSEAASQPGAIKEIARRRLAEGRDTMAAKMKGAGRKRPTVKRTVKKKKTKKKTGGGVTKTIKRTSKKRKLRTKFDIFTSGFPKRV